MLISGYAYLRVNSVFAHKPLIKALQQYKRPENKTIFVNMRLFKSYVELLLPRLKIQTLTRSTEILRDNLETFIESSYKTKQNLSYPERGALRKLMLNKNKIICKKDMEKILGLPTQTQLM